MDFIKSIPDIVKSINLSKEMYLLYYYIIINIYAFLIFGMDKYKARKKKFRTRELKFFIVSILLGALGAVFGMTVFRHKTQKPGFYMGIPFIFLINILSLVLIYKYLIVK